MASPGRRESGALDLTIWGISDTELLAVVDDLADENGWTSNIEVRLQLGENLENGHRSGAGSRIAWMRRFGWLEQHPEDGRHRLTAMGHAILEHPELSRAVENALSKMNPAQRVRLAREIGESSAGAPVELRQALRRQWQRSMGR
jgi:hypothetical protein